MKKLIVLLLAMGVSGTCSFAISQLNLIDGFESMCVKGRISAEQAEAINVATWGRAPGYCNGQDGTNDRGEAFFGQTDCRASEHDRVLNASCSNIIAYIAKGD
jgi:hypothetical protein